MPSAYYGCRVLLEPSSKSPDKWRHKINICCDGGDTGPEAQSMRQSSWEDASALDHMGGRRAIPGLKRTMARRQPSSVLSICMSRILDTSSVSTLKEKAGARVHIRHVLTRVPPRKSHWALVRRRVSPE